MPPVLIEKYRLWTPNSFSIFKEALLQKSEISVECCLRQKGQVSDFTLKGVLINVSGSVVLMDVSDWEVVPCKSKDDESSCSFSFCLEQKNDEKANDGLQTGFSGRGSVLKLEVADDGRPLRILLRLSRHYVTRKMRRDKRKIWPVNQISLLGLTTVDEPPASREELRLKLNEHYQEDKQIRVSMINISAGGVCLDVTAEIAQRRIMSHEFYLFFLVPDIPGLEDLPYIFLGKKAGLFRDTEAKSHSLRIRFFYELEWAVSQTSLHWSEIEGAGSARLRQTLRGFA